MKYVAIIIAILIALATLPMTAMADDDDGGAYAGTETHPTIYHVEDSGTDQAEGEEETDYC